MSSYSSRAQPFLDAIANAAFAGPEIRNWLLAGTKAASRWPAPVSLHEHQHALRPNTRQPFYSNYWCGKDSRCTCRPEGSRALETDMMLFFENEDGDRLAVHVEFKAPGEKLSFGQAEAYRMRAECWARGQYRPRSVMPHQHLVTVIFCATAEHPAAELAFFDRVIAHADARDIIPGYP